MPALNSRTWRPLIDAVYEMNAADTHADFVTAVTAGLNRLIRADVCVLQLLDRASQRIRLKMIPEQPFTQAEIDYYSSHPADMPFVPYYERTGDIRARRLSDVVSTKVWQQSDYYRSCLQRQDLLYALALPITVDTSIVAAVSFNRRRPDFTLRDCALLDAFAPHFRLAWARQKNPWQVGLAGTPVAAGGTAPARTLTSRENDVLFWITEGKQNREIADILGLRITTVQEYVANILRKLHVENRHALTVLALRERRSG